MLKGQHITTLDKSGRLRLPSKLRKTIEGKFGKGVFVTSLDCESIHIFPVLEWMNIKWLLDEKRQKNLDVRSFVRKVNRLGVIREIDNQGRMLIHNVLRDKVNLMGNIIVEGGGNHWVLRNASSI